MRLKTGDEESLSLSKRISGFGLRLEGTKNALCNAKGKKIIVA